MITVEVTENSAPGYVTITATRQGKQILKSPMKVARLTRNSLESQINKELKDFNGHLWGGMTIHYNLKLES